MIKRVFQVSGENVLTVEYKSGARRFCYIGDSCYIIPGTVRKFMSSAHVVEQDYITVWEA